MDSKTESLILESAAHFSNRSQLLLGMTLASIYHKQGVEAFRRNARFVGLTAEQMSAMETYLGEAFTVESVPANSPDINVLVALNTFQHFKRAAAKGVFFNSPDLQYFDGSAEGYWARVAKALGATDEEIARTE